MLCYTCFDSFIRIHAQLSWNASILEFFLLYKVLGRKYVKVPSLTGWEVGRLHGSTLQQAKYTLQIVYRLSACNNTCQVNLNCATFQRFTCIFQWRISSKHKLLSTVDGLFYFALNFSFYILVSWQTKESRGKNNLEDDVVLDMPYIINKLDSTYSCLVLLDGSKEVLQQNVFSKSSGIL